MLDLKEIETFYPERLRPFKANMLREYLQYKILDAVYSSEFALRLVFMGGTAIHIAHGMPRFSEDLDFDNKDMNRREFEELSAIVARKLTLEGCKVEVSNSFAGAYRSAIKFIDVLFDNKLSGHKAQKLTIHFDAARQDFAYKPDSVSINKFDIFTQIEVVPQDILLAQKIYAILERKRTMGRDFYDALYLLGKTAPNMDYIKLKTGIDTKAVLKERLLKKCAGLDFDRLAGDVANFLFNSEDAGKISMFKNVLHSI